MRASILAWAMAVVACVVLGFVLATVYAGHPIRPRHFGYYLAIASFVAGLVFGVRGALLPAAGIAAFGVAVCMPPVMLQLDAEGEVIADDRDEVLSAPAFEGLGLRRCGQELAHLFEANLVTPDRCHYRNVVGTRPQLEERLRVTLTLLG